MNTEVKISRGEVFYIVSKYDTVGSEQRSGRPAVVVSNNLNNEHSECVEICYLTLQEKKPLPTHVKIENGVCSNSTVLCEQVTTISKERVGDYLCRLPDDVMDEVDKALSISLGIDYLTENNYPAGSDSSILIDRIKADKEEKKALMQELSSVVAEYEKCKILAAEAEMYKNMYNTILDRLVGR